MREISVFKERILQYLDVKGISKYELYQKTGVSNGILSQKNGLSEDSTLRILSHYQDINPAWLLTGEGPMLKGDLPSTGPATGGKGVPLVSAEAAAGFGSASFSIGEDDIIDRYQVPDFREVDFMLRLNGDSMAPTYNGGDVVGCLDIKDSQFLQWGRVYLLATHHQGLLVKRIKPGSSDATLTCVSDNAAYDPFEIDRSEIAGIALVVGTIRLE